MAFLVLAEHDNAGIKSSTLSALAAAREIGDDEIHLLVAGQNATAAASEASRIGNIAKILHSEHEGFAHGIAGHVALLIGQLANSYSHILAPASTYGKNILPVAAALLNVQQLSDITGVEQTDIFWRPIYAGNALAKIQMLDTPKLLTVRSTAFEAVSPEGGNAPIETVPAPPLGEECTRFVRNELTPNERPELTSAGIVISGGRGMQSSENFAMLERIADMLGAAVGASRAAVDSGFAPNDYQVGQTGKVVAPELYIAVGISGAIQHLAGMKDSKIIVAINKDPDAPIFQIADYGLVADLFEAIPQLEQAFK